MLAHIDSLRRCALRHAVHCTAFEICICAIIVRKIGAEGTVDITPRVLSQGGHDVRIRRLIRSLVRSLVRVLVGSCFGIRGLAGIGRRGVLGNRIALHLIARRIRRDIRSALGRRLRYLRLLLSQIERLGIQCKRLEHTREPKYKGEK